MKNLLLGAVVAIGLVANAQAQMPPELCRPKYQKISDDFYIYNEKSALVNAVMDRIASYADGRNVMSIRRRDAQDWYDAMRAFDPVAQSFLQQLLEYRASGCDVGQVNELKKMIDNTTNQLKINRDRINAMIQRLQYP